MTFKPLRKRGDALKRKISELPQTSFFEHLPCVNGHTSSPRTNGSACLECLNERKAELDKKYYEEHEEKIKARSNQWRLDNPEKEKENSKRKHLAKRETELVRMALRYIANREADNERKRIFYAENPELCKSRHKTWRDNNKEVVRASVKRRKLRMKGVVGGYEAKDIERIYKLQNGRCAYCRVKLGDDYHRDHIIPISKGGTNNANNIQLTCEKCNLSKRASDPLDYARRLGKLL